jgi:transcriptional regulator with XRE-family HTH domain
MCRFGYNHIMRSSDIVRIARQRAGLTQQQLAHRSGHPRETIARWETAAREPSLQSLRALVRACGLELVVALAEGDDSLTGLVDDQLALAPADRLRRLLPADDAKEVHRALSWLAAARSPSIVVGGVAAALQGAPQRPRDVGVEVVASDPLALTREMEAAGFEATDSDERFAESDRRWPWKLPGGGAVVLAGALPGSGDFADLRRSAQQVELDGASVRVAHPRDLLRLADASIRESEQARVPGLRALLSHVPATA